MWADFREPLLAELEGCGGLEAIRSCLAAGFPPAGGGGGSSSSSGEAGGDAQGLDQQRSDVLLDLLAHSYQQVSVMGRLGSHSPAGDWLRFWWHCGCTQCDETRWWCCAQARSMELSPLQASTLLSIVWRSHCASVQQRLTIERSFQLFR